MKRQAPSNLINFARAALLSLAITAFIMLAVAPGLATSDLKSFAVVALPILLISLASLLAGRHLSKPSSSTYEK